eukprot:6219250-Heterocapsa_arctica.AAC.1
MDVKAGSYTNITTDHKMLTVRVKQQLKAIDTTVSKKSLKGVKAINDKQREGFQVAVNNRLDNDPECDIDSLMNLIAEAAEDNLTIKNPPSKRNDCEPELQYIINDRHTAVTTGTEEQ